MSVGWSAGDRLSSSSSMVPNQHSAPDDAALESLLQVLLEHYGYDFREYARASLRRRIWSIVRDAELESVEDLRERLLQDGTLVERVLLALSVNVTALFRDPGFFLAFRRLVVPRLRTYPYLRIWHA